MDWLQIDERSPVHFLLRTPSFHLFTSISILPAPYLKKTKNLLDNRPDHFSNSQFNQNLSPTLQLQLYTTTLKRIVGCCA